MEGPSEGSYLVGALIYLAKAGSLHDVSVDSFEDVVKEFREKSLEELDEDVRAGIALYEAGVYF